MDLRGIPAGVEERLLDLRINIRDEGHTLLVHLEEDLLEKEEEYLRLRLGDLDLLDPLLLLLDPVE